MRVAIIGGGVIGLSCAWAVSKEHDVVVLDRGALGEGASRGNAGWITASLSGPLPAPGVMRQAASWLGRSDSPLRIRPRISFGMLRWAWHFARNCNADAYARGLRATLALSAMSETAYEQMAADGIEFERHRTGLLYLATTEHGLELYRAALADLGLAGYGSPVTHLEAADCRRLEATVSGAVIGGFHTEEDWYVQPQSLCVGLERHLRATGVTLRPHTAVARIEPDGSGWRTLVAGGEVVTADVVVVAAGAFTGQVLRSAGVRMLMEPAKGYSLTGQVRHKPTRALYMIEAKVGCSPYADSTRIAGTLELGGFDETLDRRRLESLERAAARYLTGWRMTGAESWAGFRPATPDGLPYIGETHRPGLYVASGHGMLGVTLGAGTGTAIGRAIAGDEMSVLQPFRPGRRAS